MYRGYSVKRPQVVPGVMIDAAVVKRTDGLLLIVDVILAPPRHFGDVPLADHPEHIIARIQKVNLVSHDEIDRILIGIEQLFRKAVDAIDYFCGNVKLHPSFRVDDQHTGIDIGAVGAYSKGCPAVNA